MRIFASILLIACMVATAITQATESDDKAKPRSASDYFLLLPKRFTNELCFAEEERSCLEKVVRSTPGMSDDFLEAGNDGGSVRIGVLHRQGTRPLVAVQAATLHTSDFYALDWAAGRRVDVSRQVVPELDNRRRLYQLMPGAQRLQVWRVERDGEAENAMEYLYELWWKDGRFVRAPKTHGRAPSGEPSLQALFARLPAEDLPWPCATDALGGCPKFPQAFQWRNDNVKHGYLSACFGKFNRCVSIARFRRADGGAVIGVRREDGPMRRTRFVTYADGRWTDVSAQVMPGYDPVLDYLLPEYGTVVTAVRKLGTGPVVSFEDMAWRGDGRFAPLN